MDFERAYSKRMRMEKAVANEFSSCQQFLDGPTPKDKDELRDTVVNRAIQVSLADGLLKTLKELCNHSRLNGTTVAVNIQMENWEELVLLINKLKGFKGLDEWDLIEFSLKSYLAEMKFKRQLR
jgi:hypothetical protein